MRKARQNPLGMPLDRYVQSGKAQLVMAGKGKATHLLGKPRSDLGEQSPYHLCRSGVNAGRGGQSKARPKLYKSEAKKLTCVRCQKMATMNLEAGRQPWDLGLD